jgi:GNAT superfamily N-acetyltransferase
MTAEHIRQATASDLEGLSRIAADMSSVHEPGYFERCLAEQADGKRVVLVAETGKGLTGYIQLDIPEIQDLNVVPAARRHGLGARLVESCEAFVRQAGKPAIGIGVGLYARYGTAQRLYIKMGYIPDGAGVCYDDSPVGAGDFRSIDDQLTIKLIKTLS